MRKPARLHGGYKNGRTEIYGGFDEVPANNGRNIYIGGSYYSDSAQLHLNERDVHRLAEWISKASRYLKQKNKRPKPRKKKK